MGSITSFFVIKIYIIIFINTEISNDLIMRIKNDTNDIGIILNDSILLKVII